ncbi:Phage integrase [Xenorhabdus bovienii str. puntauvense]|uniref:Phage integrase n=1 Tax=Xenorhabdus bovienii str. puntauvense TaxID=1398201 RepID=A0A077NB09_XENBV|nr:site-specific integrase [Xenorhabdus bovienii]CDG95437.1 Phage integrase [Xenorhabdus bovienii str. puntauvense]
MALSDTWLRSVVGKERDKQIVKSDRDGLSVRITPKGKVVFQFRFQWNGKGERVDIGTYPATSLKDARDEVIRLKGEIESNRNPRFVKKQQKIDAFAEETNEGITRQWYESYCIKNKKEAWGILRSFELHVFPKIGDRPHSLTTLHDWLGLLEELSEHSASISERVLINAKQVHKWGVKRQLIVGEPLVQITGKDLGVSKREGTRVLEDEEIKVLFQSLEKSRASLKYELIVKLLLLFACRLGELLSAEIGHFDLDKKLWSIPPENHKTGSLTGRPLIRPIIPQAEEMIRQLMDMSKGSKYLITKDKSNERLRRSSLSALPYNLMRFAWRKLNYQFPHWSLHDLRRTARTNFSALTEPHVAEIMLGHKLPGVWQVYDKSQYIDEQRKAYGLWWSKVEKIVYGDGKVSLLITG